MYVFDDIFNNHTMFNLSSTDGDKVFPVFSLVIIIIFGSCCFIGCITTECARR